MNCIAGANCSAGASFNTLIFLKASPTVLGTGFGALDCARVVIVIVIKIPALKKMERINLRAVIVLREQGRQSLPEVTVDHMGMQVYLHSSRILKVWCVRRTLVK